MTTSKQIQRCPDGQTYNSKSRKCAPDKIDPKSVRSTTTKKSGKVKDVDPQMALRASLKKQTNLLGFVNILEKILSLEITHDHDIYHGVYIVCSFASNKSQYIVQVNIYYKTPMTRQLLNYNSDSDWCYSVDIIDRSERRIASSKSIHSDLDLSDIVAYDSYGEINHRIKFNCPFTDFDQVFIDVHYSENLYPSPRPSFALGHVSDIIRYAME